MYPTSQLLLECPRKAVSPPQHVVHRKGRELPAIAALVVWMHGMCYAPRYTTRSLACFPPCAVELAQVIEADLIRPIVKRYVAEILTRDDAKVRIGSLGK